MCVCMSMLPARFSARDIGRWRHHSRRSGLWRHQSVSACARTGLSGMQPMRRAWAPSGCATVLLRLSGKPCAAARLLPVYDIPPTKRPYTDRHAYCLFFSKGTCGACINRCPAGAISAKGHDKEKCKAYIVNATLPYVHSRFGMQTYACGLCQTKVPCESGIP